MGSNETRPTLEEAYAHYEREGGDSTTADILAAAVARVLEDHTTPEDCERAGKSHDFITSEVGTRTFCQVCGGSWAVAKPRTIFDIAAAQGWNAESITQVMGGFIAESGNLDNLAAYAEAVAKRENGE